MNHIRPQDYFVGGGTISTLRARGHELRFNTTQDRTNEKKKGPVVDVGDLDKVNL